MSNALCKVEEEVSSDNPHQIIVRHAAEKIGHLANMISCNTLRLLQLSNSVSTYFVCKEKEDSFRAQGCYKVPLKFRVQRVASGASFLQRHPSLEEGSLLYPLVIEYQLTEPSSEKQFISESDILSRALLAEDQLSRAKALSIRTFLILENAWKAQHRRLFSLQLEIGRLTGAVGELVVASPFTPRSWRLDNLQLSQGDEALMNCYTAQAEESSRFIDSLITKQVWSPLVGIIMGSQSDWATMKHAAEILDQMAVPYETKIVSAHRTPTRLYSYARGAEGRGLRVIIAGAGGAAHLPGMTAALTPLPVLGVPVKTSALGGQDSLLSIVQMPRGVPVGTLAIGEAGAANAAILATSILSSSGQFPDFTEALKHFREKQTGAVALEPTDVLISSGQVTAPKPQKQLASLARPLRPIPPGGRIGILGGGQLAKMIATAAAELGYKCHVYCPDKDSPAFHVADEITVAGYTDEEALQLFVGNVDVVTYEFENVPVECVEFISNTQLVCPAADVLATCQDRLLEKQFVVRVCGAGSTARFVGVHTLEELKQGLANVGLPAILKTARGGYDGKGQVRIDKDTNLEQAWSELKGVPCILEAFVPFIKELSVIVARGYPSDTVVCFPATENEHEAGILRRSVAEAGAGVNSCPQLRAQIQHMATQLALAFDLRGIMCIEMFLLPPSSDSGAGRILINEIAPRPHNSGHWTIEGATTSQYQQMVRAICGLSLGQCRLLPGIEKVVMTNLIGEDVLQAMPLLEEPNTYLHLYGKTEIKKGRKMGHVTMIHWKE